MQNLVLIGAAFGIVAVFVFGWVAGYRKAIRAHGWYLPKTNWDNDAVPKTNRDNDFDRVQKQHQANYE